MLPDISFIAFQLQPLETRWSFFSLLLKGVYCVYKLLFILFYLLIIIFISSTENKAIVLEKPSLYHFILVSMRYEDSEE